MREIRKSGLMSGDVKQGDAGWPKPLRSSSTLRTLTVYSLPVSRRTAPVTKGGWKSLTHLRKFSVKGREP